MVKLSLEEVRLKMYKQDIESIKTMVNYDVKRKICGKHAVIQNIFRCLRKNMESAIDFLLLCTLDGKMNLTAMYPSGVWPKLF